jgi:hypothetical protein
MGGAHRRGADQEFGDWALVIDMSNEPGKDHVSPISDQDCLFMVLVVIELG